MEGGREGLEVTREGSRNVAQIDLPLPPSLPLGLPSPPLPPRPAQWSVHRLHTRGGGGDGGREG